MQTALNEITLVLFTTLAPSGAFAYIVMTLPLIVHTEASAEDVRRRIDHFLSLPLVVAMIGLIASATHLGNPANALYVLTGVGRSPLSNEVACAVLFLGAAGVFWLTSFSERVRFPRTRRVIAACISLTGVLFIASISVAYDVDTIITWSLPTMPLSIWLNALSGGSLLSLLGFRLARFSTPNHRFGMTLLVISSAALIASVIVYLMWGIALMSMGNAISSASDLVPAFFPLVGVFAFLSILAEIFGYKAVRWEGQAPLRILIASALCMLLGIFVMRFMFYMAHLTIGVSV